MGFRFGLHPACQGQQLEGRLSMLLAPLVASVAVPPPPEQLKHNSLTYLMADTGAAMDAKFCQEDCEFFIGQFIQIVDKHYPRIWLTMQNSQAAEAEVDLKKRWTQM